MAKFSIWYLNDVFGGLCLTFSRLVGERRADVFCVFVVLLHVRRRLFIIAPVATGRLCYVIEALSGHLLNYY